MSLAVASAQGPSLLEGATYVFDPSNWGAWIALTASLLVALLGSSVLATWITRRGEARARETQSRRSDAKAAMRSLRRLRTAYLLRASEAAGPGDADLGDLANRLFVASAFTGDKGLVEATQVYVTVGELYAAQDAYTSSDDESSKFFDLLERLRRYLT